MLYFSLFKARFLVLMQYRSSVLAGIATQAFWGVILVIVLTSFYASTVSPQPISLSVAENFIWINQALLLLLPWKIDRNLEKEIRSGNIAYELCRPVDLYGFWYTKALTQIIVPTLLRAIPIFAIAGIFFGLEKPVSDTAFLFFILSLVISCALSSAIITLVHTTLFWTVSGEGIVRLLPDLVVLLSGLGVPLPLYPDWVKPVLLIQPFRFILDFPCRIYTGIYSIQESIPFFIIAIIWTLFFVYLGRKLLAKGLQKLSLFGG